MADKVQKLTTEPTFHEGVLYPAGSLITIDTTEGDFDFGKGGNTPNLADAKDFKRQPVVEVAPIAPSGPNPTAPQQIPPGTLQTGAGFVDPEGNRLVGEGGAPAEEVEEEKPARRSTKKAD